MKRSRKTNQRLAVLLMLAMIMIILPLTGITAAAADEGDCTHVHGPDCSYQEAALCLHIHDETCGYAAEGDVGCTHVHDAACGYAEAVPCDHVHDENCGGLLQAGLPQPAPEEATVTFTITGEGGYGNMLYLPGGVPVTDAALLAGVSAADENGDSVEATVKDTDGLNRGNPQPREGFGPYIITYEAVHPETGEAFTATREAYVTMGIMPLASSTVTINPALTVSQIQTNIQTAIDAASFGDTVTVLGTYDNANGTLTLRIPAGRTVFWAASYTSTLSPVGSPGLDMIVLTGGLTGGGNFEVGDYGSSYGSIKTRGAYQSIAIFNDSFIDRVHITVSGHGSIANEGSASGGCAIWSGFGFVTITDDAVVSTSGNGKPAITSQTCQVTVSGNAKVSAVGNGSDAIRLNNGTVTVSGSAEIIGGDGGNAIHGTTPTDPTREVDVVINGGAVKAGTSGFAILIWNGSVTLNDGTVDGNTYGTAISTARGSVTINGGAVSSVNSPAIHTGDASYASGDPGGNVYMNSGIVTSALNINGGVIEALRGNIVMIGGTVSVTGNNTSPGPKAALLTDRGTIAVKGGSVSAAGTDKHAIYIR